MHTFNNFEALDLPHCAPEDVKRLKLKQAVSLARRYVYTIEKMEQAVEASSAHAKTSIQHIG